MYKRAIGGLALLNLVFLFSSLCVRGITQSRQSAVPMFQTKTDERVLAQRESSTLGIMENAVSEQRILHVQKLESGGARTLEPEEAELLMRIVEAEAGNQGPEGKLLVANVVLNRVASENFPDNVTDVVLQNTQGTYQFSPVGTGRIWGVTVSGETREAVERALDGEDISEGALYFAARAYADKQKMKWFDEHLTFLFEYGGHEFFR